MLLMTVVEDISSSCVVLPSEEVWEALVIINESRKDDFLLRREDMESYFISRKKKSYRKNKSSVKNVGRF